MFSELTLGPPLFKSWEHAEGSTKAGCGNLKGIGFGVKPVWV